MTAIRLLIVDDHLLLRDGIAALLQQEPDIAVVGHAQNGREALDQIPQLNPEVVLMDIAMPVMDGLQATQLIKDKWPKVRVLILSMHDEPEYIRKIMHAGASGYVLKDVSSEELLRAIATVHQHGSYFSSGVSNHLFQAPGTDTEDVEATLTARETEVLKLIATGLCNKDISRTLKISIRTVESHRQNLRTKLGIQTTAGLTHYAIEHRLI